jgi:hypothetical protein
MAVVVTVITMGAAIAVVVMVRMGGIAMRIICMVVVMSVLMGVTMHRPRPVHMVIEVIIHVDGGTRIAMRDIQVAHIGIISKRGLNTQMVDSHQCPSRKEHLS